VSTDWRKSGLNLEKNEIRGFAPFHHPPGNISTLVMIFTNIHQHFSWVRFLPTFFMQKVSFQRVWFEFYGCLNERIWFS